MAGIAPRAFRIVVRNCSDAPVVVLVEIRVGEIELVHRHPAGKNVVVGIIGIIPDFIQFLLSQTAV